MRIAKSKRTEEGLTLLESLIAIMIIAIVITTLTPPMLIAFASRVQNYRASQAQKIAQGEIDRVRLLVEKGEYGSDLTKKLPPKDANSKISLKSLLDVGAPSGNEWGDCYKDEMNNTGSTPTTTWCTVDSNGDGDWDLGVQTFRTYNPPTTEKKVNPTGNASVDIPIAMWMGVRVYTRAALTASPRRLVAPQQRTASLGLTAGQSITLPLVNRYVPIVRSDWGQSRYAYCELYTAIGFQNNTSSCN